MSEEHPSNIPLTFVTADVFHPERSNSVSDEQSENIVRVSYTWDVYYFENELQQASEERQRLIEEIRQLEATIAELEEQIRSREAHAESLSALLQQCKEELDRIKSSGTYKLACALATPIRKLRALFKR